MHRVTRGTHTHSLTTLRTSLSRSPRQLLLLQSFRRPRRHRRPRPLPSAWATRRWPASSRAAAAMLPPRTRLQRQRARTLRLLDASPSRCVARRGRFVLWARGCASFGFAVTICRHDAPRCGLLCAAAASVSARGGRSPTRAGRCCCACVGPVLHARSAVQRELWRADVDAVAVRAGCSWRAVEPGCRQACGCSRVVRLRARGLWLLVHEQRRDEWRLPLWRCCGRYQRRRRGAWRGAHKPLWVPIRKCGRRSKCGRCHCAPILWRRRLVHI
jgi:hypothetical protein